MQGCLKITVWMVIFKKSVFQLIQIMDNNHQVRRQFIYFYRQATATTIVMLLYEKLEQLIITVLLLGYVSDGDVLQYDIQSRQILVTDPGYMSEGPVYNDSK